MLKIGLKKEENGAEIDPIQVATLIELDIFNREDRYIAKID